jgi:hypothetical protein
VSGPEVSQPRGRDDHQPSFFQVTAWKRVPRGLSRLAVRADGKNTKGTPLCREERAGSLKARIHVLPSCACFPGVGAEEPLLPPLCPSSTFTRPPVPYPPPACIASFNLGLSHHPDTGRDLPPSYLRPPPSSAIQPANGGSVHAANEGPNRMSRASPAPITAAFNIPLASSASR